MPLVWINIGSQDRWACPIGGGSRCGCTWAKLETQNHESLALVCPMEGWENNIVEAIIPQGIPYHSGCRVLTFTGDPS